MKLTVVVVGKSREELALNSLATHAAVDELVLLANPQGCFGGLGRIGNAALTGARGDVVGLVHADTSFGPGTLGALAETALRERALTGIVGATVTGERVWGRDVSRPVLVSTLDSCCVFVPRAHAPHLCFDENRFDGFHCCVEDLCLQAASRHALSVLVVPGEADHLGSSWNDAQWKSDWARYRQRLDEKWRDATFSTT